jgi:LPS O-antigen subunit length determinant protein (WzzB/FepE family)
MEDQEIELMESLRVLWWGKWIIIGCFVLVLGIALAMELTRQPSYTASVTFRVWETLSQHAEGPSDTSAGTECPYAPSTDVSQLMQAAVDDLPPLGRSGARRTITTTLPDRVTISVVGAVAPSEIGAALDRSTEDLTNAVASEISTALSEAQDQTAVSLQQQSDQLAYLRDQMGRESDESVRAALAEQVAEISARLAGVRVRSDALATLAPASLFSLDEVNSSPVAQVSRSVKLTLAVAGLLGLLLGVILAFFIHYLILYTRGTAVKKE